jgi:N-formylglutamate deformylase
VRGNAFSLQLKQQEMNTPYFLVEPKGKKAPVILSVPHSGVEFPEELKPQYRPEMAAQPDDTDWFVHKLYDFVATELGITVIHARYSRWVIDLNRDPESKPLYDDGRIITGLTPSTDFLGNEIYLEKRFVPDDKETERRLANYYRPYYQKIESLLAERIEEFGRVLLWDAHSIRRFVPTIRKEPFPDLILGDNDEQSADKEIIEIALNNLRAGKYELNHNTPFKGGHITRHFGKPEIGVHALQLEMAKINYMNDDELTFDENRAEKVRKVLRPVFEQLISHLTK